MTLVYVAGPMSGYPAFNVPAFDAAAERLRAVGYDVLNPADHGRGEEPWEWSDYLRAGIAAVLRAELVAVLPNWQASRGACLEVHIAHALNTPVLPIEAIT